MTFAPDDFAGRPYAGANNQAMHVVFGAALCGVFLYTGFPVWAAATVAGSLILAWEAHQLINRGATRVDYIADLCYWWAGVAGWAALDPAGVVALAPIAPLMAWVVEYARIKVRS